MGSAPRVKPPTEATSHPLRCSASSPSAPMSASPSGLIVVSLASMYNEDCRPEESVKLPRFAERSASNSISVVREFISIADGRECLLRQAVSAKRIEDRKYNNG